jgi:hypothetical protein
MRLPLVILALLPLAAQTPPAESPATVESPVPVENQLTGSLELGYRWTDVAGSLISYRSIVDLGSGPKLLRTEFGFENPKRRLFDRVDVRAYNWGDDPYSTLNIAARKQRVYDFSADYRNTAYFNFLPSFGNPQLGRGVLLSQRSFDIRRRTANFRLDLLPGKWIVPYLAYERSSGSGRAITTFVSDANEYPVPSRVNDHMNNYRGGVRLELLPLHVTIEQGGTTFKDDQSVFDGPGARNLGNREAQFLGQTLFLGNLLQAYGIRATSYYTKAAANVALAPWLNLSGEFLYSRPESDTNYQQFHTGNSALLSQLLLFTAQEHLLTAQARLPRKTAVFGAEVTPHQRLRIFLSGLAERLENSGSTSSRQSFSGDTVLREANLTRTAHLQNEYNHAGADVVLDVWKTLTFRTGYRYAWGEAQSFILPMEGLQQLERGGLRRHVFSGGASFRPTTKLSFNADAEGAASGRTYFRTSLHDYQRGGFRLRYQLTGSVNVAADYRILNNRNPAPGIDYDFRAQQTSLVLLWAPAGGKRVSLQGDYTRSTLRSDITYLVPQILQRDRSLYRDNGHSLGALIDFGLPGYRGLAPKMSAGGSLLRSSGSRPTAYYRPLARISLPVRSNVAWVSEWKYHGFGEAFYTYEAFRTHLIETGIRFTR